MLEQKSLSKKLTITNRKTTKSSLKRWHERFRKHRILKKNGVLLTSFWFCIIFHQKTDNLANRQFWLETCFIEAETLELRSSAPKLQFYGVNCSNKAVKRCSVPNLWTIERHPCSKTIRLSKTKNPLSQSTNVELKVLTGSSRFCNSSQASSGLKNSSNGSADRWDVLPLVITFISCGLGNEAPFCIKSLEWKSKSRFHVMAA